MKNIITNILGLVFWYFSILELKKDSSDWTYITFLLIVGIVLFRYKWSESKVFFDRVLKKKADELSKKIGGEIPRTDDEG